MNSTPDPKEAGSLDASIAGTDERLARAHEEIKRADEQLTRMSEQLAKMERDDARPAPAGPGPQSPPAQSAPTQSPPAPSPAARPALRTPLGLLLTAACVVVAALILQSAYGDGAKLVVARWAPQLASTPSSPPENPPPPAEPAPSTVQAAAAEPAPPQATTLAQAAPQNAAPAAAAAPPDQTQLLQTIARDLANLERNIEQLKTNQQQMATDNAKAIGELKASQEDIKRGLAKVSEQTPPRISPPPTQPAPIVRRPERTYQAPPVRPRQRYPREWIYDDW